MIRCTGGRTDGRNLSSMKAPASLVVMQSNVDAMKRYNPTSSSSLARSCLPYSIKSSNEDCGPMARNQWVLESRGNYEQEFVRLF